MKVKVEEEKHGTCTIRLKISDTILVFFQNFSSLGTYVHSNWQKHTLADLHITDDAIHCFKAWERSLRCIRG